MHTKIMFKPNCLLLKMTGTRLYPTEAMIFDRDFVSAPLISLVLRHILIRVDLCLRNRKYSSVARR